MKGEAGMSEAVVRDVTQCIVTHDNTKRKREAFASPVFSIRIEGCESLHTHRIQPPCDKSKSQCPEDYAGIAL